MVTIVKELPLPTKKEDVVRAARLFKAISHPLRLRILCSLIDKERSVKQIVKITGTSQSNISQHLTILRDIGFLSSRKNVNYVYHKIADKRTISMIRVMQETYCSGH